MESEPTQKTWLPQPKQIRGIDIPDRNGGWDWKGKGLLRFVSSHWEVLSWGERESERWMITWFGKSLFTPEGVDSYSDLKEGGSEELLEEIMASLKSCGVGDVEEMCEKEMREITRD